MKLSIVTTLYRSSAYIAEFHRRMTAAVKDIFADYEIIFVDDGSPDNSLEKTLALKAGDTHIKVIELSRNFGHHKALMAGLEHASGDLVFMLDSDMEEAPENLNIFYQELQTGNWDVVYGVQNTRNRGFWSNLTGSLYYRLFKFFSGVSIPHNLTACRLMRRAYIDALLQYPEEDVVLAGVWSLAGFRQHAMVIEKPFKGETSYTLSRKLEQFVNSITGFSAKPLVYIFYLGLIISLFSGFMILWFAYRKLFFGISLVGWTSLIVSIWFIGGMVMLSLGVVGIYVERIFRQVKGRPRVLIRRIHD
jgi:putative glycosyltransferase